MPTFDLPNVIKLQQDLIKDLSGKIDKTDDDAKLASDIGLKVGELSGAVSESNMNILPTLTKQDDVQAVLDREAARLQDRKQAIDAASVGQQRLVDLTRNATQRNRAINNMYIVAIVGLLLYLGIRLVSGLLPEMVNDIMTVLVVSITILMILKMYADYTRRNNMDYDMINLGEPSNMVGKAANLGSSAESVGSGLIESRIGGGCVKDACCPEGTKYNEKYAICVPVEAPYSAVKSGGPGDWVYFMPDKAWKLERSCKQGYSPDDLACKKESFTTMKTSDMAKPNEPFEFADYNLYK